MWMAVGKEVEGQTIKHQKRSPIHPIEYYVTPSQQISNLRAFPNSQSTNANNNPTLLATELQSLKMYQT